MHEEPAVSARSEVVLEENMVVTIEPGFIFQGGESPNRDVVIVENRCEIAAATKELLIL